MSREKKKFDLDDSGLPVPLQDTYIKYEEISRYLMELARYSNRENAQVAKVRQWCAKEASRTLEARDRARQGVPKPARAARLPAVVSFAPSITGGGEGGRGGRNGPVMGQVPDPGPISPLRFPPVATPGAD